MSRADGQPEGAVADKAERYTFITRALSVARGLNYSNAFEFALKLMETCYVVAERFSRPGSVVTPFCTSI